MPHTALTRALAASATVAALVGATLTAPTAQAAPADQGDRTPATSAARAQAESALRRAQDALAGSGRDATMALRDLWLRQDDLSAADKAAAARLAGRPVKSNALNAGSNIKVHYNPGEMTNFSAQTVADISVFVSNTYSGSGYRQPKADNGLGGDNRTDVYVDDLGPGLYGYCTTDQQSLVAPGRYDVWAYCVVNNDYSWSPAISQVDNLKVTIAHEYFHATQFAYDAADDGWLMEGSAAWVEDEVYDDINDNRQYLATGPLSVPTKWSMDKFAASGKFQGYHYGTWIFLRYLSEKFKKEQGSLPKLMLDVWKGADSSVPAKDKYGTQALAAVLKKQKFPFDKAFSLFSDANRRPAKTYSEGKALKYPSKPLAGQKKLAKRGAKAFKVTLDHLTSATYRYVPKGKTKKLKVSISGASKSAGGRAVITTWKKNGKASQKYVVLSKKGKAFKTVSFAPGSVKAVEVTLVNASIKFDNCYKKATPFSCSGKPRDENKKFVVLGKAV